MISSKTKKTKNKYKYTIVTLVIVAAVGSIVSMLMWVSYVNNPDRIKNNAYAEVSRNISVIDLEDKMVHVATRDDGCHEYRLGFASGTSCTISGEKMYVSSTDVRTNINKIHRLMSSKGWTTERRVSNEIDRFTSEEDRVIWISYYHKDTSMTLLALKRSSKSTGWGRIPEAVFDDLKVNLNSNTEYLYGFVTSEQYKETRKSFFSPAS